MATLSLRLDILDNTDVMQPLRPRAYTVLGLACGSRATVSLDPARKNSWIVKLAAPGHPWSPVPGRFLDPHAALRYVQKWVDPADKAG
jgi:hypothetical protein